MGVAFQCDRCKKFECGTPAQRVVTTTTAPPVAETKHELCPSCLAELADWMRPDMLLEQEGANR